MYNKRALSLLAILMAVVILTGSFSRSVVNAQTPNPTETKDFSVKIVFTKAVLSMTTNSITLYGGAVIKLKPGMAVPAGVKPGVLVTIVAEVERGGFTAESIAIGNKPAPVATQSAVQTAEAVGTKDALESTAQATLPAGTEEAKSDDCSGKTPSVTAQRLANAFSASAQDVSDLHCKQGYGYDDIARALVMSNESRKAGKPTTAAQILSSHDSGKGWDDIRKDADVKPESLDKSSTVTDRDDVPKASRTPEKNDDKGGSNSSGSGGKSGSDDSGKKDDGSKSGSDDHKDDKGGSSGSSGGGDDKGGSSNSGKKD